MSSLTFFVAGSIHQDQGRFSDQSRERQCSFMSFSALLCAQTLSIENCTSATVDQILFERGTMYLNAFEDELSQVQMRCLVHLPDRARSLPIDAQRNSLPIEVTTSPSQWPPIEAKTSANQASTQAEICLFRIFLYES